MIAVDFPRNRTLRAIVIGLDGTPCSLIDRFVSEGRMPNFAALMRSGSLGRMDSVLAYRFVSGLGRRW